MKKLIYAIASVTALTASIDSASAVSLVQGAGKGNNPYDDYISETPQPELEEVLVASAQPLTIDVAPPSVEPEVTPEPAKYEYQVAPSEPGAAKRTAIAPSNNSYEVITKSEPQRWERKKEIPEPSVVMGMLAIAGAMATVRRKGETADEKPLS